MNKRPVNKWPVNKWPVCGYHFSTRRRRQIPKTNSEDKFRRRVPQGRRIREDPLKTNSEDAFREDDFHPEGELQPEDEF